MTADEYWSKLKDVGWVANIPKAKQSEVRATLAKMLPKNKRDAHYALAATAFDAECIDGSHDYRKILTLLAEASGGVFAPKKISVRFDGEFEVCKISFQFAKKRFAFEVPISSDWFQMQVLDQVNDALRLSKSDARFIPFPSDDQILPIAFVPPSVYQKAVTAKLAPKNDEFLAQLAEQGAGRVDENEKKKLHAGLASKDRFKRMLAVMDLGSTFAKAKDAFPLLVEALNDEERIVREEAATALARVGKKAVPALESALKDAEDLVKIRAACSLWKVARHPAAFPVMLSMINKTDEPTVNNAFAALKEMNPEPDWALPLIKVAFAMPQRGTDIAFVIEWLGPNAKVAMPFLLSEMRKRGASEKTRYLAAHLCAKIGPAAQEAVPDLIKLMHHKDVEMQHMAIFALGEIGPAAKDALPLMEQILADTPPQFYLRDALKRVRRGLK